MYLLIAPIIACEHKEVNIQIFIPVGLKVIYFN